jgi:molecular chaperone GrpE
MTDKATTNDASAPAEAPDVQSDGVTRTAAAHDAAAGSGEAGPESDVTDELRHQRDEYRDRLLRTVAEFDNYRKRVDRERRERTESAAADLIQDLLPLVDDLERALEADATTEEAEAYRRGVELIHRQILDLLRKRDVRPIEALGATFDPRYHEAIVHEHSPSHRDGEVIGELRRGYMLGNRLLRPAMVKVAKA